MAPGVDETEGAVVRRAARLVSDLAFDQRFPGGAHPLFPLGWGLRWVVGVEEKLTAERTCAPLPPKEPQGEIVHRRRDTPATPGGPVLGQGRIVG